MSTKINLFTKSNTSFHPNNHASEAVPTIQATLLQKCENHTALWFGSILGAVHSVDDCRAAFVDTRARRN